jgi:hypothetical protein
VPKLGFHKFAGKIVAQERIKLRHKNREVQRLETREGKHRGGVPQRHWRTSAGRAKDSRKTERHGKGYEGERRR